MKFSRRDLLVWGAGAAAGLVVTPVPWKLLDDTAKWSQNWGWIPQPTRGPVEVKQSACTLCPNGCGLRVRMAGGWPVGVAGVATHPVTRGALCPLVFGAHQLNWHPERLKTVRHRGVPASWEDARAAFAKACSSGPVVVVDGYPGRAASQVLSSFARKRGEYCVVHGAETRAFVPYEKWSGVLASGLGYDLENVRTVVSFGVPLLDGWGMPGRFTRLWAEKASGQSDPQLRVIQIESSLSRTASLAYQWISILPGSESALASAIARVLLEERLVAARGPIEFPGLAKSARLGASQLELMLAESASQTGLSVDAIRELARTIAAQAPVVAIARDENPALAALNVVLGAVGTKGGIVRRSSSTATPHMSADAAIGSARAVVLDSSVPWNFELATDAEVYRFAAWNGGPTKSDWLLPAPGFLEELTDVPSAPTSGVETYGIAPALTRALHKTQSCAEFMASFDSSLDSAEKIVHTRCAELFRARRGTIQSHDPISVAQIESAEKLEERLRSGAVWVGELASRESIRCAIKQWPAADASSPLELNGRWPAPVMATLATKLYQESGLRESGRNA